MDGDDLGHALSFLSGVFHCHLGCCGSDRFSGRVEFGSFSLVTMTAGITALVDGRSSRSGDTKDDRVSSSEGHRRGLHFRRRRQRVLRAREVTLIGRVKVILFIPVLQVDLPRGGYQFAFAAPFAIFPFAFVNITVFPKEFAVSVSFVILPFSIIFAAKNRPYEGSFARSLVVLPSSVVATRITPDIGSISILFIV